MNGWVLAGIITLVSLVVVLRRVRGEPLEPRELWVPPLVLTGIGGWILLRADGLSAGDYAWSAAGLALGGGLGYLRGSFVVLFVRGGGWWQRYTGRNFVVTIGSLLVLAAFAAFAARLGSRVEARPLQLSIGVSFLGEALAVTRRARSAGTAFVPDGVRR